MQADSSSANHAETSVKTGSTRTPRPARRTLTRSPSNLNSRGSRTAWLRPFLNSLAVVVTKPPRLIYTTSIYQSSALENHASISGGTFRLSFQVGASGRLGASAIATIWLGFRCNPFLDTHELGIDDVAVQFFECARYVLSCRS